MWAGTKPLGGRALKLSGGSVHEKRMDIAPGQALLATEISQFDEDADPGNLSARTLN